MEIIFFMMKIYLEIQLAMWSQKNVSIAIPLLGNDVWNKRERERDRGQSTHQASQTDCDFKLHR